ncbi:hypothetical protein B0H13DRAFT_1858692 [Mycena leptocephala]|nr:hypothetical protein B0H13DRAFT_1858692 [Mycena leptocephala]
MHDCGMDNIHGNQQIFVCPSLGFPLHSKSTRDPMSHSTCSFICLLTIDYCREPHVLINELKGVERQNSVASLSIRLGSFNYALFDALCGFSPVLTRLRIDVLAPEDNVDDVELWDWKVPAFLERLANFSPLPPNLKQLALFWNEEMFRLENPDFAKFRDDLTARYPAMNAIWLRVYDFTSCWHKTSDGAVRLRDTILPTTNIEVMIGILHDDFKSSWREVELHI